MGISLAFSDNERFALMTAATEIADRAGEVILEVYETDFDVRHKGDNSPVTEADERAEAHILPALRELLPGIPAIGEEAVSQGNAEVVAGDVFWLVDPVDGTKEFLRRSGEFTVNIALVEDGVSILGVVTAPALNRGFRACGKGTAECREGDGNWQSIAVRSIPADGATVASSRSHRDRDKIEELLSGMNIREHVMAGSSLKFCLLAEGTADVYPRYGPTSEWDTAAGHAVLSGAGGSVRLFDETELPYGKSGWCNPEFIARGAQ
jgi:3'(2'), 5'-bisphosphate nucleotidase